MGGFIRIFGSTFEVAFHPETKKELESDARLLRGQVGRCNGQTGNIGR
jgi:hypothetical protein